MGSCISSNNSKIVIKNKVVKTLSIHTARESEEKYKDMEGWEGNN